MKRRHFLAMPLAAATDSRHTDFPIGSYSLPKTDEELRRWTDAGFNLFRCANRADLDRVARYNATGWLSVPVSEGATDRLRKFVEEAMDHPALRVWEGPDEFVHMFTAYSGLYRQGVYTSPDEWNKQTEKAIQYSEEQARIRMPKLIDGIRMVKRLDRNRRPFWLNEAPASDAGFVRQYLPEIDITGCDIYPIKGWERLPAIAGDMTRRWTMIGRGKPVWMVLQGFSWNHLQGVDPKRHNKTAYPTLVESRNMAWDAIAHGAAGILYFGLESVQDVSFLSESIFPVTREIAAHQKHLTGKRSQLQVDLIPGLEPPAPGARGVIATVCNDQLLVVVNEGEGVQMGVQIGDRVLRLRPHEVKLLTPWK